MRNGLLLLVAAMISLPLVLAGEEFPHETIRQQALFQLKSREARLPAKIEPLAVVPFDYKNWQLIRAKEKIKTGKALRKALSGGPKDYFKPYLVGNTIETKDWILVSLDPGSTVMDPESPRSLWVLGHGVRKGTDVLIPWGVW